MSNIVENNNSFVKYNQVWSNFVFTDNIPEDPPNPETANNVSEYINKDNSIYTVYTFRAQTDNSNHEYLLYLSNFQLTKEFRQGKDWKLEFRDNEEFLRNVILPGTTTTRKYTPTFSTEDYQIPFTSLDPYFDLRECRIKIGIDLNKLYFSGWLYVGKSLTNLLDKDLKLPFDDTLWILKDTKTTNKVKFDVSLEKTYKLPGNNFSDTEDSDTLVSTTILNETINTIGRLDEGVYW